MRTSKNRQSGFIKNCSSPITIQPEYQPHYNSKDNESFSKFDDQFSSFCYKYPQEESQNQFSLFVFSQKKQIPTKVSKGLKNVTEANFVKENNMRMSNKRRNEVIEESQKNLDEEEDQPNEEKIHETHKNLNTKKPQPFKKITTNYYSATTTYARQNANKVSAENYQYFSNQPEAQYYEKFPEQSLRQNYMSQQSISSPRAYEQYKEVKEVGKLKRTSKDLGTGKDLNPIQFNKKYHEDMYENGEQYYRGREEHQSQKTGFSSLKRIKSDDNLFAPKNIFVEQYVPQSIVKKSSKHQVKYATNKHTYYPPTSPKNLSRKDISYQEYPHTFRKPYNEVQQSSVVESEPSFLKERLEEVERRKLQLIQKKRQLEELKKKSRLVIQDRNIQPNLNEVEKQSLQYYLKYEPKIKENPPQQTYSDSQQSDVENSQNQQSESESSDNSSESQNISEIQSSQTQKYDQKPVQNPPKSPQNIKIPQNNNFKNPKNVFTGNSPKQSKIPNQAKTTQTKEKKQSTPQKIITKIQKRAEQLKREQLKEMYQKQGISVAKGGVSFDIDTKDFIHPQKDTIQQNFQNIASSPSQNTVHKQSNVSKESYKNPKQKQQKVNSKEELKRRREMAKSYDRYARNKIFGVY